MNFAAFYGLSTRQWLWMFTAWWRLWMVEAQLKFRGMPWLIQQLNTLIEGKSSTTAKHQADAMFEAVRLAERCHPLPVACLGKSLVLNQMLQRKRIPSRLRIGVSLPERSASSGISSKLASHAWVELGGHSVGEDAEVKDRFTGLGSS